MRQALYALLLICAVLAYMIWTTPEWQLAIGSTALSLARPVAIPIIHLINTPAFIYLLSLLLLRRPKQPLVPATEIQSRPACCQTR